MGGVVVWVVPPLRYTAMITLMCWPLFDIDDIANQPHATKCTA
jgi:hypothetical protein